MGSEEYTDCYGCTGAKTQIMCGWPMSGCLLCKTYGDNMGKLKKEFRHKTVEVRYVDHKGTEQVKTFVPPSYSCTMCEDKKVAKYMFCDDDLRQPMCSDGGLHNMPRVTIACHKCCSEEEHNTQMEAEKAKYFAAKKSTTTK